MRSSVRTHGGEMGETVLQAAMGGVLKRGARLVAMYRQ